MKPRIYWNGEWNLLYKYNKTGLVYRYTNEKWCACIEGLKQLYSQGLILREDNKVRVLHK